MEENERYRGRGCVMAKENNHREVLTECQVASLYIESVKVFADTASKLDMDKGIVFDNGKRLFNEAIKASKTV
jgi:hypothetical protein